MTNFYQTGLFNKKYHFVFFATLLLVSGCATDKTQYRWVQLFQTNTSFEQASAQCEYETHLQNLADSRANPDEGPLTRVLRQSTNNTQVICMKRFGFGLEKIQ